MYFRLICNRGDDGGDGGERCLEMEEEGQLQLNDHVCM